MHFTDQAIVLNAEKFGESNYIVQVLSHNNGRYSGLARKKSGSTGLYQPGNIVKLTWKARLSEHLGNFQIELESSLATRYLDNPAALLALQSACQWCVLTLPERQPYADLYADLFDLLQRLDQPDGIARFVAWEVELLRHLGYGLDISCCALSGERDDLSHVSPKSGRAVSRQAAEPWASRLLSLPPFLLQDMWATNDTVPPLQIWQGLQLSGHFLDKFVLQPHRKSWPMARILLNRHVQRTLTGNSPQTSCA